MISFNKVFRDSLSEAFFLYKWGLTKLNFLFHNLAPLILQELWPVSVLAIGTLKTIILSEFVPCLSYMIIAWDQSWTPAGSAFINKWQHINSMDINHFQQKQLLM